MIITKPEVNWENSILAYEEFSKLYNKNKPWSKRLRSIHWSTMKLYISFFEANTRKRVYQATAGKCPMIMRLDTNKPFKISTNTTITSQLIYVDDRTVYRILNRLEEAGLIKKKFNGIERNHTITINPFLFDIQDLDNSEKYWKASAENAFSYSKLTSCTPNRSSNRNNINNIIIHSMESDKSDILPIETKIETGNGNTGSLAKNSVKPTKNNPLGIKLSQKILAEEELFASSEKLQKNQQNPENNQPEKKVKSNIHVTDTASTRISILKTKIKNAEEKSKQSLTTYAEKLEKREKQIKDLQHSYAILMLETMLDYLNPTFKCYNKYFRENVDYIEQNYFAHYKTFKSLDDGWHQYYTQLQDGKRFKDENPDYTPYPRPFFDKENLVNGFNSVKWKKRKNDWDKRKQFQTDQRKLMNSVKLFNDNPIQEVYDAQIEYLQNATRNENILKAFFKIVSKSYNGKLPEFNTEAA